MICLGLASNYSFGRSLRHLFACGTRRSSQSLRAALAPAYGSTVDQVALYHSGRSALTVALKTLIAAGRIAPGSRVIVPGLTCIAVVRGIRAAGCEPLFCDIMSDTLEYDYQKLSALLADPSLSKSQVKSTQKGTKPAPAAPSRACIIVQNTLGYTWDIAHLEQFAKQQHLTIIEDLAHSAGRLYPDGRPVGTVGAATILSFGKGKAIDTITGGALVLRLGHDAPKLIQPVARPPLATRLRDRWYPVIAGLARTFWRIGLGKGILALAAKLHLIERSGDTVLDPTLRLTHWQACLALAQFRTLQAHPLSTPLREFCLVTDRSACLAELYQHGYKFDEIWYDTPVAPARLAEEAAFPAARCPTTVKLAAAIINLPTWVQSTRLAPARAIIAKYQEGQ